MKELIEALASGISHIHAEREVSLMYGGDGSHAHKLDGQIKLLEALRRCVESGEVVIITDQQSLPCTVTLPPDGREGGISLGRGTSFKKLVEALEYRRSVTP